MNSNEIRVIYAQIVFYFSVVLYVAFKIQNFLFSLSLLPGGSGQYLFGRGFTFYNTALIWIVMGGFLK